MKFLHGDVRTRVSIVCQETGTEHMEGCVREIAWFPMFDQTKIIEAQSLYCRDAAFSR